MNLYDPDALREAEIGRLVDIKPTSYYDAYLQVTGKPPDNSDFMPKAILGRTNQKSWADQARAAIVPMGQRPLGTYHPETEEERHQSMIDHAKVVESLGPVACACAHVSCPGRCER